MNNDEEPVWVSGTVQEFLGLTDDEMAKVESRHSEHKKSPEKTKLQQILDLNDAYAANLEEGHRLWREWTKLWPTLTKQEQESAMEIMRRDE